MSQSPPERSCTSACDCSPFSFAVLSPQGASAAGREADLCRRSTAGAVSGSYDERLAPTSTSDAELTARGLRRESSRPSTPSSFGVHSPTDARNASTPTIGVSAPRSETSLKCCPAAPLGAEEAATAILEATPDEHRIKSILVVTVYGCEHTSASTSHHDVIAEILKRKSDTDARLLLDAVEIIHRLDAVWYRESPSSSDAPSSKATQAFGDTKSIFPHGTPGSSGGGTPASFCSSFGPCSDCPPAGDSCDPSGELTSPLRKAEREAQGHTPSPPRVCHNSDGGVAVPPREILCAADVLAVTSWYSPSVRSPLDGKMMSVTEVCNAASGSLIDLSDARVQDDALSRECVVLAAIERQQGQEEEEEGEGKERREFDMEHDDDVDWEICAAASPAPPLESLSSGDGVSLGWAQCIGSLPMSLPVSGSASDRQREHYEMASKKGFNDFACQCSIAKERGAMSCLERFGKEHYRRWHAETCELCSHRHEPWECSAVLIALSSQCVQPFGRRRTVGGREDTAERRRAQSPREDVCTHRANRSQRP